MTNIYQVGRSARITHTVYITHTLFVVWPSAIEMHHLGINPQSEDSSYMVVNHVIYPLLKYWLFLKEDIFWQWRYNFTGLHLFVIRQTLHVTFWWMWIISFNMSHRPHLLMTSKYQPIWQMREQAQQRRPNDAWNEDY